MILSHAHLDHCGNLPNLVKHRYTGPIYATAGTADLTDITVRDSGHIQEADAEYLNKKQLRKGLPPVEPLYTLADAEAVKPLLVEKLYNEAFRTHPGRNCTVDRGRAYPGIRGDITGDRGTRA